MCEIGVSRPLKIPTTLTQDDLDQTLTFHGTSILSWEDRRLVWEPKDYGQLGRLSFTEHNLGRFWTPAIKVKGVGKPTADLMQYYESRLTLTYKGRIMVETSVSIRAPCRVDLTNYPYDNQTCHVLLYPSTHPSAKVSFSATPAFLSSGGASMFSGSNATSAVGYDVVDLAADRFFMFRGLVVNESWTRSRLASLYTNSVLRYQVFLRRNAGPYLLQVALPLYSLMLVVFIGAVGLQDFALSAMWLAFCLLLQLLDLDRMMQLLPKDYDSEPFCGR